MAGAGDLRLYMVVKFGSLLLVLVLLAAYPARYSGSWYYVAAIALYAVASVLESFDRLVLTTTGGVVSGHTLKHVVAAGGVALLVLMLRARRPLAP